MQFPLLRQSPSGPIVQYPTTENGKVLTVIGDGTVEPRPGSGGGGNPSVVYMPLPSGGDDGASWNAFTVTLPAGPIIAIARPGRYLFKTAWLGRSYFDLYASDDSEFVNAHDDTLDPATCFAFFFLPDFGPSTVLTADIAENDQSIQVADASIFAVGDTLDVSWPLANFGCLRVIQDIAGNTLWLSEPMHFPVAKPVSAPGDSVIYRIDKPFEHCHIYGGTFTWDSHSVASNPRLVENATTRNCGWHGSKFIVPTGVFLVAVLGIDAGNSHMLVEHCSILLEGTATTQNGTNTEEGCEHITFRHVVCVGCNLILGGVNNDVIIEQCTTHSSATLTAGDIFWFGEVHGGKRMWSRGLKILGGSHNGLFVQSLGSDVSVDSEIGEVSALSPAYTVNILNTIAGSIAADRPKNIKLHGLLQGGTNAPLNVQSVEGLFCDARISKSTGGFVQLGIDAGSQLANVVLSSVIEDTSANSAGVVDVGRGCVLRSCKIIGGTTGAALEIDNGAADGTVFVEDCEVTSSYQTIVYTGTGRKEFKNVSTNKQFYTPGASCTLVIEGVELTAAVADAFLAGTNPGNTKIRDMGHNNFSLATNVYNPTGAATIVSSNGTIALNGATPVTYLFPLESTDLVQIFRETPAGVPAAGTWTVTGNQVVITGTAGDTSTMRVCIGTAGARAGRFLATS